MHIWKQQKSPETLVVPGFYAETIARYRELAPLCFTATANLLNYQAQDGSSEINTLIERYRQKKMSLDQFITEADSKIQMILSERQ